MMTLYEKNLLALPQFHPELKELLAHPISTEHIRVQKAESGAPRLEIQLPSGNIANVHNTVDPLDVAKRTAAKLNADQGGVLVVMGMGLGYLANELALGLQDGSALIVYEADPAIFKTALEHVDLSPIFSSPHVKIVVGPHARLEEWCLQFMLQTGGAVRLARFEPAFRLAPELYETKWEKELLGFTQAMAMNFATVGQFGPLFSRAILEAVPHIMFSHGVKKLANQFKGLPAVLVAAGPSLEKNVHCLKEVKGRAVIICADTVLGYLLARDIVPDFVVSVDPQGTTFTKYEGVDIPDNIALVFHPACNDQIFKRFPGPKFVTETRMVIYQWLNEYFPEKGTLEGDIQCQMHMGFNLAKLMGCEPLIMMGQDLCYTDSLMHVKGGSYLTESEEEAHVARGLATKNMFGETVNTYPVFWSYKSTFERKIEEYGKTVFNATEGGLPMKGAEIVRLRDLLPDFPPPRAVDVPAFINQLEQEAPHVDWEALIQEVGDRIRDFHRIIRVSKRILKFLEAIQEEQEKGGNEFTPQLFYLTNKTERLTSLVPRYAKALGLLQMVDFGLELYMLREETDKIDSIKDQKEKLSKQVERGIRYYGALLRAAPPMRGSLVQLLHRLQALKTLQRDLARSCFVSSEHLVQRYVEVEMFDQAAMEIKAHHHDILTFGNPSHVLSVLLKVNALKRARLIVEEISQEGSGKEISEVCQAIKRHWESWEARRTSALSQMKTIQEKSSMPLDAGDFYFLVKNFSRAAEQYRKAIDCLPKHSSEGWYRLAKTYQALSSEQEAVNAYHHAMVADPSDSRVYFELGVLAIKRGQFDVAERFFQKGAEMVFDDAEYCEAVGSVWDAVDEPRRAIPFYERAILGNPSNGEVLSKLSKSYQSIFGMVPAS